MFGLITYLRQSGYCSIVRDDAYPYYLFGSIPLGFVNICFCLKLDALQKTIQNRVTPTRKGCDIVGKELFRPSCYITGNYGQIQVI